MIEEIMPTLEALALVTMAIWVLADAVSKIVRLIPLRTKVARETLKTRELPEPEVKTADNFNVDKARKELGLKPLRQIVSAGPAPMVVSEAVQEAPEVSKANEEGNSSPGKTVAPKPHKKHRKQAPAKKLATVKESA